MGKTISSLLVSVFMLLFAGIFTVVASPDEGMYPLSDIDRAGLKKAGLKISEKDIYDPGKTGLVDALVRVGGCSGSFVSPNGLIITNHHCAFSAVQLASTAQMNYLEKGFVAQAYEQEIQAQGLTIRITDSYEDVSGEVLGAVEGELDPLRRIDLITAKRKEIAERAVSQDPTIEAEVSEMFIGRSYVLFRYKTIEDVRLVYVPRQDIGEFGGESDNWVWPRHTGDFSFLRAYVAPDGSSAPYAQGNVPYQPKKHLKINPKGVKENDFAFILGYPGRTFRHRPAQYLEYQERFLLPYTAALNQFQNEQMYLAGKDNTAVAIRLATRIKRNANVMKNYQGKMKGMRNIGLVAQKQVEDQKIAHFIENDASLKARYGTLMDDIDQHYRMVFNDVQKELWMTNSYRSINLLRAAQLVGKFKLSLQGKTAEQQQDVYDRNIAGIREQLKVIYQDYDKEVDLANFIHLYEQAIQLDGPNLIAAVRNLPATNTSQASLLIRKAVEQSKLNNEESAWNEVFSSVEKLAGYTDGLLTFQQALETEMESFNAEQKRREGVLNKIMGDYVAVKELYQDQHFVPDANSTLRLTYGYIKGYSPVDATYMAPFTTIRGIIEKGFSSNPEYVYPQPIRTAWEARDFGPYQMDRLGDVPVNLLYNMDTTGGNSGSPIMNADGELIGVNFDRAYDATINDFAWNESYSRSIGVDVRYVLWVAEKIDNADFILREMGVYLSV